MVRPTDNGSARPDEGPGTDSCTDSLFSTARFGDAGYGPLG